MHNRNKNLEKMPGYEEGAAAVFFRGEANTSSNLDEFKRGFEKGYNKGNPVAFANRLFAQFEALHEPENNNNDSNNLNEDSSDANNKNFSKIRPE